MATMTLATELAFSLLDHLPDGVIYYKPLPEKSAGTAAPDDFEVAYCNQQAAAITLTPAHLLTGQRASSMVNTDDDLRRLVQQQLRQVYQTGQPVEHLVFNAVLGKHFGLLRTRVAGGVLTLFRDKTRHIREQEEKDRQAALTNSILDTSLNAVFACEAIRDEKGTVIDLEMKHINRAFTRMTGLGEEQVVGKRYLDLFPSARENGTFAMNCEVIETGRGLQKEIFYKGENLDAWYEVSLCQLGKDGLVVSFDNINRQKNALLQITQQKALLDNILQHSANGISVTKMIRNKEGRVIDWRTVLANEAAVKFTGIPKELYLQKNSR